MAPMHDLVIKNALVFDGSKAPGRHASLAVADGCITAIGRDVGPGRREIDADGLALAPGIIDSHTHYDAQITWDAGLHPSPELGVTTVVIGNCGFTIAPCRPEHRDITMRNLTHVEGMSLDVLRSGIRWEFETFPEYLALLERLGSVPNVAAFIGHSSLRIWVMGNDATARAAKPAEIAQMRRLVGEALGAGAVGFATSTARHRAPWSSPRCCTTRCCPRRPSTICARSARRRRGDGGSMARCRAARLPMNSRCVRPIRSRAWPRGCRRCRPRATR